MPEPTMPTGYGAFCWNQLNTPDMATSKAFYEGLFSWQIVEDSMGGVPVTYIHIGRFAVLRDPVGATLSVFQGA